jgi:hypothetical protein
MENKEQSRVSKAFGDAKDTVSSASHRAAEKAG